jgi:branched-chain amino acid transport system permease protein
MSGFLQFVSSGLTMGAIYALVAVGFVLIYNACDVVNFAQGEFVMLGGMVTVFAMKAGLPMAAAMLLAVACTTLTGWLLYSLAVRPAHSASAVTLIIITIGASIFIRGLASVGFDKNIHNLPALASGDALQIGGASIQPQSLVVLAGTAVIVVLLLAFLRRTLAGKALLATSANRDAAQLVGIDTLRMVALSFGVAGAIGAIGGILIAPIALVSYDVGGVLALKGFTAAVIGGLGHPIGAVAGGLLLGLLESFGAGYLSSQYKDAIAFALLLATLMFMPQGLFSRVGVERV